MSDEIKITSMLRALRDAAPAGYALAFHVRYMTPRFLFQTYPKAWSDHYSQNGLVMSDPTVAWGFEHLGYRRWSDLADADPAGVLAQAADHGLAHGVTIAVETGNSRSLGSFAHATREFGDDEIAGFAAQIAALHALTAPLTDLGPEAARILRQLAVQGWPGGRLITIP